MWCCWMTAATWGRKTADGAPWQAPPPSQPQGLDAQRQAARQGGSFPHGGPSKPWQARADCRRRRRLLAMYSNTRAGFEVVHGVLDRLMEVLGVPAGAEGYTTEAAEGDGAWFPGRQVHARALPSCLAAPWQGRSCLKTSSGGLPAGTSSGGLPAGLLHRILSRRTHPCAARRVSGPRAVPRAGGGALWCSAP